MHLQDYDTLSEQAWWTAEYEISSGSKRGAHYYPDDFRWPECPVSTLTAPHENGFDPIAIVEHIGQARTVGGRGAIFATTRRDARLYDAAAVIESCRAAEHAAAVAVLNRK